MSSQGIDHTEELKRRLLSMSTEAYDTCSFWEVSKSNVECKHECRNCAHGIFIRNGGELEQTGYCEFDKVLIERNSQELEEAKRMLETLVSNIKGGIITCIFNNELQSSETIYINPGWTEITGYTLEELNNEKDGNPQSLVFPEDKPSVDRAFQEQMSKGTEYELMYRVCKKDGSIIWVLDRGIASPIKHGRTQNQSIVTEMTALKEREDNLRRLAQSDQLTTLYNKETTTLLAQAMLEKKPYRQCVVYMLDIDGFKQINDSIGHAFGDAVLREVSECLRKLFKSDDIIGRLGGDEFGIITTDVLYEDVKRKAEDICESIRQIRIDKWEHASITVSLGIAFSKENMDWQTLYEQVDMALYTAKSKGKDQYYLNLNG
ncbi:MAG: sensor domain-containing diguanylate cyclase [Coprobacillus sp.]